MLASRILQAAEDILADYEDLKASELLQQAMQLASRNLPGPIYTSMTQQVRAGGKSLGVKSRLRLYPQQMRMYLQQSAFNIALPESLGKFLVDGFKGDVNTDVMSPEVQHIKAAFDATKSELLGIVSGLKRLRTQPIIISPDRISVDFVVPREAIDNDTSALLSLQQSFLNLTAGLNEFIGSDELSAKLVYTSTTDPVIAVELYAHAAYAVVKVFAAMLVSARAMVELHRAVKLVQAQPTMQDVADKMVESIESTVRNEIQTTIRKELATLASKVDEGRKNELLTLVTKTCEALVPKVAQGVSIGVSVESITAVSTVAIPELAEGQPTFEQIVLETRKLETTTRTAITIAGGAANLRLTHAAEKPSPSSS